MRTNHFISSIVKTGTLFVLIALLFTACKKDKKNPPQVTNAKVSLLVSSPGAPELSFFINGTKSPTVALLYNTVVGYMSVKGGSQEFAFKKKDATETLDKITPTLKLNSNYTVIFADKSPKTAVILVEDDLSDPAANKAKVRFANLSPDAPALDLYIAGKTDAALSKKVFKDVSAFVNIDPGTELKFEIKENGKTDVLATLEKFKIEKGKIYTIWARGLKDATDATKLGIDALTNK